ncbi:MAG: 4-hydroxythreonine-4-phosphate dehydrogenase PdxA [Ignavibacteriaceae bacterium]
MMNRFVITCGDINGIGPEIVVKSLNRLIRRRNKSKYYFICPKNIFQKTIKQVKPGFDFKIISTNEADESSSKVSIINLPDCRVKTGYPTKSSGLASYKALQTSFSFLKSNIADAVITAPVSKTALNMAGIKFPGQTEMFVKWSGSKEYVMTFLSNQLNVALQTIHIPLKNVYKFLNEKELEATFNVLINTLNRDLAVKSPRIALLGLNPHAGENGLIGTEEEKIVKPVIKKYSRKIIIDGPFPADAFFAKKLFTNYNFVLGMYHDQVLIPFKYLNSGFGVNYTAGLPIVRTSPDHGVAYDIAGKNIADEKSMLQAVRYAEIIVNNRRRLGA